MRSADDILAELEDDRASRESEVRLIEAQLATEASVDQLRMWRRMAVLLLYAHMEGFAKFALTAYLSGINAATVSFSRVNAETGAAALSDVFSALANDRSKFDLFRRSLPDDTALHRYARRRTFVSEYEGRIGASIVRIPESVIDTESNLSSVVLKRNLFVLGLPHEEIASVALDIDALMNFRNQIAHGDRLADPKDRLPHIRDAVGRVMNVVQSLVYEALARKTYERAAA
jgi:hypothetical protein